MNDESPSDFAAEPNTWHDLDVRYEGEVTLYLEYEQSVDGKIQSLIREYTEQGSAEYKGNDFLIRFSKTKENLEKIGLPCKRIILKTSDGVLDVEKFESWPPRGIGTNILCWRIHDAIFTANSGSRGNAKYWAIPLINFIFTPQNDNPMLQHILRVSTYNRGINFTYQNAPAFIEKLDSYPDVSRKLKNGENSFGITSIAVGEIAEGEDWWPSDFHTVLSFVCGTQVSSHWIEQRDEAGKLCKRIHHIFKHRRFASSQYTPIASNQLFDGEVGVFLSDYLKQELVPRQRMGRLLFQANQELQSKENDLELQAISICLFLERFAEYNGIPVWIYQRDVLDAEERREINKCIQNLNTKIKEIKKKQPENGDKISYLNSLRLKDTDCSYKPGIWPKVRGLIHDKGFFDVDVIDQFATNSNENECWVYRVSKLRNSLVHEGIIKYPDETRIDCIEFILHLHDLAIRLFLDWCGYGESYLSVLQGVQSVKYVTKSTTIWELGFSMEKTNEELTQYLEAKLKKP